MRVGRATGEVDTARGNMHDEQQVVRDQAALCPNFYGREVDRRQDFPMGFEKRGPRRLSFPVRSRLNPMLLQDVSDRRIRNGVADIGNSVGAGRLTVG